MLLRAFFFVALAVTTAFRFLRLHELHAVGARQAQPERVAAVREAIAFAFESYERHAWGHDELRPLSASGDDAFCGMGATIVDALDTLWLAGLHEHFRRAAEWAVTQTFAEGRGGCSLFETNIRVVGGLLSAAQLSGDRRLVSQAESIGRAALPAFDSGLPCNTFPPVANAVCGSACLAEAGTFMMEFAALSAETGNPEYARGALRVNRVLMGATFSDGNCPLQGLTPQTVFLNSSGGASGACMAGLDGCNDSYYEYLLKTYKLTGDASFLKSWRVAMRAAVRWLARCSDDGLMYFAKAAGARHANRTDHLTCFAPGMLLYGDAAEFRDVALATLDSCLRLYTASPTMVGAESVKFKGGKNSDNCRLRSRTTPGDAPGVVVDNASNLQRPEVIESVFYAWRATRDEYYRTIGWAMFRGMNASTRTARGFASASNVATTPVTLSDRQQSFFLAETLKYYLLLFSDDNLLDLDAWVLNTEAHPLRRLPRDTWRTIVKGVKD